jgi:hypothetical protein
MLSMPLAKPESSDRNASNPYCTEGFYVNADGFVRSQQTPLFVIPAKAGIQEFQEVLDPGFRRGDGSGDFSRVH